MNHPFKVGGEYRNRHGKYEVVGLEGQKMVIRYADGRRLETSVGLQARIWSNIQAEETLRAPASKPVQPSHRPRSTRRRGLAFRGLQDHDFQNGVGGTSWRARTGLGGLLAEHLSDRARRFFQSYAIYRRAEVHVAQPTHYDAKIKWQQVKFVFELDPVGATYGFYIEKNDGPMDDTWDWPRFLAALRDQPELRQRVDEAARRLELRWEVYVWDDGGLIAKVPPNPSGWAWQGQQAEGEEEEMAWPALVQRLDAIATDKWCDLYLLTSMSKEDAIAAGTGLADAAARAYDALLPLYDACRPRSTAGTVEDRVP